MKHATLSLVLIFVLMSIFSSKVFSMVCFEDVTVLKASRFYKKQNFCFDPQSGKVVAYEKGRKFSRKKLSHKTIVPGFIDLQINGGWGKDFVQSPEAVLEVAYKLPRYGVTSFAPTLVSSKAAVYKGFLQELKKFRALPQKGARILKAHLEGPFLTQAGVHDPEVLHREKNISAKHLEKRYGPLSELALVTLAPEYFGVEQVIEYLRERGIVVSIGHSKGDYSSAKKALEAGATMFTHLFNAMSPLHHRKLGLPLAALLTEPSKDHPFYSIIADGFHVAPEMIDLAYRLNPNLVLVSDAMAGLGMKENSVVKIGSKKAEIVKRRNMYERYTLEALHRSSESQATLAGSVTPLNEALENLIQNLPNVSLEKLFATVTLHPAKVLGMEQEKNLEMNSDADFLIIDGDLSEQRPKRLVIEENYIGGKLAYSKYPEVKVFQGVSANSQQSDKMAKYLANMIFDLIAENNLSLRPTLIGLATGSTPIDTYKEFIKLVQKHDKKDFLDKLYTFNLDEYLIEDLPVYSYKQDKRTYAHFMEENLFKHLYAYGLKSQHTYIPRPSNQDHAGWHKGAKNYEDILQKHTQKYGGLDLQIVGVGENGHLGFCEPPASLSNRTSVVKLAQRTRKSNKRFFSDLNKVPTHAISVGLGNILESKRIVLLAKGISKSEAIYESLKKDYDPYLPASALMNHGNVSLLLDHHAASRLYASSSSKPRAKVMSM